MKSQLTWIALARAGAIAAFTPRRAELRVSAFTAYLLPNPDAAPVSGIRSIVPFAKLGASIAWWGQMKSTGSKENRLDRFMGIEKGAFLLSHGGLVPGYTTSGTAFTRPPSGKAPQIKLPG